MSERPSGRGRYDRKVRSKDDDLLYEAKAQLTQLGFDLNEWCARTSGPAGDLIEDYPRPKLRFNGQLGDVEMDGWMYRAPYYHRRLAQFCATYYRNAAVLRTLAEPEAGARRGRPSHKYWGGESTHMRQRLNPILAPVGLGYYGVPPGLIALPYHFAEMAHVAANTFGDAAELERGPGVYAVFVNGHSFGVRDGQLLLPNGETAAAQIGFDLDTFEGRFRTGYTGDSDLYRMPPWLAIRAFTIENPISDTLMQALCHLRYFFEWRAVFGDDNSPWSLNKGRKKLFPQVNSSRQCDATPLREKILLVEMAYERKRLLEITPYEVSKILTPAVMDWQAYNRRFGAFQANPNARFFSKAHDRLVQGLKAFKEELEQQLKDEQENGQHDSSA